MASINRVTLIGNLGRDPERLTTPQGTPYVKLSVATHESYQDRTGAWQKSTEWHTVKVWGSSVERAMLQLRKGSSVYIEGALRSYELESDHQNFGQSKKRLWEIRATSWRALNSRESQDVDAPHYHTQRQEDRSNMNSWSQNGGNWNSASSSKPSSQGTLIGTPPF